MGAFDFLEKPLARDRVLLVVKNALEWSDLQRENQRFRELVGDAPRMIGSSPVFRQAVQQATQVARSDVSVLLSGESGTGKELLAAHIHRESPFAAGPFVKVNCAAIPTELIESELFGHEKGAFTGAAALGAASSSWPTAARSFSTKSAICTRRRRPSCCASCRTASSSAWAASRRSRWPVGSSRQRTGGSTSSSSDGRFREDLYYRLSVVPIRVPALRERLQDIVELVPYFLSEFCARNNFRPRTIDPDAVERTRALRLARQRPRAAGTSSSGWRSSRPAIGSPPMRSRWKSGPARPPRAATGLQEVRDSAERERIRQALDQTDWNVSAAARLLDTERTALHKRIRALGLKRLL